VFLQGPASPGIRASCAPRLAGRDGGARPREAPRNPRMRNAPLRERSTTTSGCPFMQVRARGELAHRIRSRFLLPRFAWCSTASRRGPRSRARPPDVADRLIASAEQPARK